VSADREVIESATIIVNSNYLIVGNSQEVVCCSVSSVFMHHSSYFRFQNELFLYSPTILAHIKSA
jgi:hypothetical protein